MEIDFIWSILNWHSAKSLFLVSFLKCKRCAFSIISWPMRAASFVLIWPSAMPKSEHDTKYAKNAQHFATKYYVETFTNFMTWAYKQCHQMVLCTSIVNSMSSPPTHIPHHIIIMIMSTSFKRFSRLMCVCMPRSWALKEIVL